jgi:hypothetical protein
MTIGNLFAFDLALPFENGGMDASGFTVAPGTAQGQRADLTTVRFDGGGSPSEPAFSWSGCLATCFWMAASALVR